MKVPLIALLSFGLAGSALAGDSTAPAADTAAPAAESTAPAADAPTAAAEGPNLKQCQKGWKDKWSAKWTQDQYNKACETVMKDNKS